MGFLFFKNDRGTYYEAIEAHIIKVIGVLIKLMETLIIKAMGAIIIKVMGDLIINK